MFIAMLTVIALVDYVIIFCCILDMVTKPMVKTAEIPEYISEAGQTMNNADLGFVCDDEEFNSFLEDQNSRIAALSSNVNQILSNIDAIIQEKKEE